MAHIIEFKRVEKVSESAKRYKALAKGQIEYFTCDNCGTRIEVMNGEFPDCCPGCAYRITKWKDAEEHI